MASPQDLVTLRRDDGATVQVHLYGATVISWILQGEEMIFVSSKSLFDNKKAIRGGIPVVFPCFGPWEHGPQHGFARIRRWTVKQQPTKDSSGNVSAVFSLCDDEESRKMWNYKVELEYTVTLKQDGFSTSFHVKNTDTKPFDFTCLLHTYFKVPDVTKVKVTGLKGLTYTDKVLDGKEAVENREHVIVAEFVDRVYASTPDEHVIQSVAGGRTLTLTKVNLPDTVVWNPWKEKAAAMADFGDDDYPEMLCVEAGHVVDRVQLPAGETFTGSQTVTAKL